MEGITENNAEAILKTLLDGMDRFVGRNPNATVDIDVIISVYEVLQRLQLWREYLLRQNSKALETVKLKDPSLYLMISEHLYNSVSTLENLELFGNHEIESEPSSEIKVICEHLEASVDLLIDLTEPIVVALEIKREAALYEADMERAVRRKHANFIEIVSSQPDSQIYTPENDVAGSKKPREEGGWNESWVRSFNKDEPATTILLVGSCGAGKSSLVKSIIGTTGSSRYILDCEIAKVRIEDRDYFFIDTPGFNDDDSLWDVFLKIIDIVKPVRNHVIFAGVWYVVDHSETPEVGTKFLDWLAAFCGNDYFPYLTFVTTRWDCIKPRYLQKYEERLALRKQHWRHFLSCGAKTYQHGKIYEDDGTELTGTLDLRNEEGRRSLQVRKMISRNCQDIPASIPRILQELIEGTSLENIAATRVLRPPMSVSSKNAKCSDKHSEIRPRLDQRPTVHYRTEETSYGHISIQSKELSEGEELNQNTLGLGRMEPESSNNENSNDSRVLRKAFSWLFENRDIPVGPSRLTTGLEDHLNNYLRIGRHMADPLSIATSLLAVITAAVESTKSLYETIKGFKDRSKTLPRLHDELEDLANNLSSLTEIVSSETTILVLLERPIDRCSQVCRKFEESMKAFSGNSKADHRDWSKMEFMGGDINDFIDTITVYKSTISVGLVPITMRTSKISHRVLQEYNEMIQNTVYDNELRLRHIDEKMKQVADYNNENTSQTSIDLKDEKAVTQQCIRVCEDASFYVEALKNCESSLLPHLSQSATQEVMQNSFEVQLQGRRVLDKSQSDLAEVISYLQERLQSLILETEPNDKERLQLLEDLDISKTCLEVCKTASEISRQETYGVGELTADGESGQVVVSTLGDLFDAKKELSKGNSAALIGSTTNETLQNLTEERYKSRFGALPAASDGVKGDNTSSLHKSESAK